MSEWRVEPSGDEFKALVAYFNVSKKKILKNPVPESEPTPFGLWREALTNKRHSQTRSVRLMFDVAGLVPTVG